MTTSVVLLQSILARTHTYIYIRTWVLHVERNRVLSRLRELFKWRKKGEKRWRKSGILATLQWSKRLADAAVPERAMTSFGRLVWSRCLANVKMQSVRVVKKGEKCARKVLSCRELIDVH